MYLKSLELHGFKSFPEKTVIEFDSGSTVIVGPNGSGKSNITDAMRWVLGELSSKNIRGAKMEDVIFVGADGYRQMNFAEVSVTFDDSEKPKRLNSEYDEITVTRRYYRSGESEYFINRKNVRLRDIYELFMNTGIGRDGYSIVGQGKIAEIISKKSEERRAVFEDTAGIAKYRYRKHESERKLQETEANMLRISDILSELGSRIGPLERSAQKARKYIDLFEKKKEADVSLWLYDMVHKNEEIMKLESDLKISRHELDMADDSIARLDAQYERMVEESQNNKKDQSEIFEEINKLREEIHNLEKEYQILENNIAHEEISIVSEKESLQKDEESARAEGEHLSDIESDLEKASNEISRIEKELAEKNEQKSIYTRKLSELKNRIDDLFFQIKSHEDKRNELTVRLNVVENIISQQSERSKELYTDIANYQTEYEEYNEKLLELNKTVEEYDVELTTLNEKIVSFDSIIDQKDDVIDSLKISINRLNAEKSALESRISALSKMLEHFDGYNNSVKYVMNAAAEGRLSGIHKPISYLLQVPDDYTVAVETSLGAALQGIVTEDENSAKEAIRFLKKDSAGRATFYPISSVKGRNKTRELEQIENEVGYIGIASDLLSCEEKYRGVISHLLGNVAVFDNIDSASVAARKSSYTVRIVTLDGQQINPGGSYTGGSARRDSGMITRTNTIDKLRKELKDLFVSIDSEESKLAELSNSIDSLKNDRIEIEEKVRMIEALKRTEIAEIDELTAKAEIVSGLISQLQSDIDGISSKKENGAIDSEILKNELNDEVKRIEDLSELREQFDSEVHDLEKNIDEISIEIGKMEILLVESRKDSEGFERIISEIKIRISSFEASASEHKKRVQQKIESISFAKEIIESKKLEEQEKRLTLSEKEKKYTELENDALDYERKLNDINKQAREISSKKEIVFEAHTKCESKLQSLHEDVEKTAARIYDEYELTHSDALKLGYPEVTKDNRSEISKRLNDIKNSLRSLGSVNVDAIDEYAELKERYETMKKQFDDLTASKEELNTLISSISAEMEVIFKDAFERINRNFGEVFKELFGGGHAELYLTDPDDVLNCGIEISAAPPGKLIKNLSLLSGGEQAFVAIALMFALIKVNPSPFCIFDEIESALDEVNVGRVASYISRFSKDIQIIMITHRRGTMEIADTLYGVTMPRHGVSKVFILDVSSVSKQKFADENL